MRENNNINYVCLGERRGQINIVIVIRNFNCENISVIVLSTQRSKAKTAFLKTSTKRLPVFGKQKMLSVSLLLIVTGIIR